MELKGNQMDVWMGEWNNGIVLIRETIKKNGRTKWDECLMKWLG